MTQKCQHCGMIHEATCPRIRAIEYHPDGSVKRVEFHGPIPLAPAQPWSVYDPRDPRPPWLQGPVGIAYGAASGFGRPCPDDGFAV